MKLIDIFAHFADTDLRSADQGLKVKICNDSRQVDASAVFFAIEGTVIDGHSYINKAIELNAAGLVVEDISYVPLDYKGAVAVVKDARATLAKISHLYYGELTKDMYCGAVTGTNGKTSVVYMLEHLFSDFGKTVGVMGTIDHHVKSQTWSSDLTTPDVIQLHERINDFHKAGADSLFLEASSHALDQKRMSEVFINLFIFTNLTRDHLDYHKTMKSYLEAKEILFKDLPRAKKDSQLVAVVNSDDPASSQMNYSPLLKVISYGQSEASDFKFTDIELNFNHTNFKLYIGNNLYDVNLKTIGEYNIYNSIAALAGVINAGMSVTEAIESIQKFAGVPGRLERVIHNGPQNVFIDYAHTDNALESVLNSLDQIKKQNPGSRVITVFGCGGDRDKGKRPLMGAVAQKYSDFMVVTSDNPRTEDPQLIINDILKGIDMDSSVCKIQANRKLAIELALNEAGANDVVLIAGKGHEDYQILGTTKINFSDYQVAKEILDGLSSRNK